MKFKTLRWISLITGSIFGILLIFLLLFVGANFIGGIGEGKNNVAEGIVILAWFLYIVSIVIAWFNNRRGALLMIFFALIQLMGLTPNEPALTLFQFSLLLPGLLLLIYLVSNRLILKNKSTGNTIK